MSPLRQSDRGYSVEVLLIETGGPLLGVGRLLRWARFAALHLPATGAFDANLAGWSAGAQYAPSSLRQLDPIAARELAAAIDESGFAEAAPEVDARFDTSDSWRRLSLRFQLDQHRSQLDLTMQSSSFEGPHAERLRTLLHDLFGEA